MALPATDNFNRANGALGTNWTEKYSSGGSATIVSNQVTMATENSSAYYIWNADAPGAAQYGKLKLVSVGAYTGASVILRFSDTLNGYELGLYMDGSDGTLGIYRDTSGTPTTLDEVTQLTIQANDVIKFTADGSTLKGYINDVEIVSATDTNYASGTVGFSLSRTGNTITVDDFEVGNISAGGGPVTLALPNTGGATTSTASQGTQTPNLAVPL